MCGKSKGPPFRESIHQGTVYNIIYNTICVFRATARPLTGGVSGKDSRTIFSLRKHALRLCYKKKKAKVKKKKITFAKPPAGKKAPPLR